jgi:hypothetical protein
VKSEVTYDVEVRAPHHGDQPKNPWCRAEIDPPTAERAEEVAANWNEGNYNARVVTILSDVGWFWCGQGHVYSFGEEKWHHEQANRHAEDGRPLPPYCQRGECMDSTHIVGPYDTKQEAKNSYNEQVRKAATRNPLETDRDYEVWYFGPIEQYRISDRLTKAEALEQAKKQAYYSAVETTRKVVTA